MKHMNEGSQIKNIIVLDPGKLKFERADTGVLKMVIDGVVHQRVYPVSSFPVSGPDKYISIRDVEDEEIGMIENLKDLPIEQQALVRRELRLRYFVPVIREIYKIKEEYGTYYWEVKTDRGKKTFYVKGRNENIIFRDKTRLLITDIEECRYEITDYTRLPHHSQTELDKVL